MLQVLQISALDVQPYNPRLYHILYTEQSLKSLNLDKERAIRSVYRDWDFLPSARFSRTPRFTSLQFRARIFRRIFASAREGIVGLEFCFDSVLASNFNLNSLRMRLGSGIEQFGIASAHAT